MRLDVAVNNIYENRTFPTACANNALVLDITIAMIAINSESVFIVGYPFD
jgi:hypothetical protein